MPTAPTGLGAWSDRKPKKKKLKKTRPATPTPDQRDRTKAARETTSPAKPPEKVRKFAHPNRKEPQKVIARAVAHEQVQATKRAAVRKAIRHVTVTPVASPDARDSERSDAQLAHDARVVARNVATSRQKAVAKAGRGAITRAVKRELEGKGAIAHTFADIAEDYASDPGATRIPGRGPQHSGVSGFKLGDNVATRTVKDLVNVPANAPAALYEPAAGVVEAAQGRPQRLKRLAKDVDEHDAVFNLGAAVVEAVKGNTKAANKRLKRAKESAEAHPGYAALEVGGVKGTVARGTGRVMRTGALGQTAKRAASTERDSKVLEGTNITVPRSWSADPITKAAQVNRAKSDAFGNERVTDADLKRRVDERVSVSGTEREPFVREFAHTSDSGKVKLLTPAQAPKVAADLKARNGHDFEAVPVGSRVALVPKAALDRLHEHERVGADQTTAGKVMTTAQDAFRRTVLTTSTSWVLGGLAEGTVRAGLNKAGPRSYVTGRRVIKRLRQLDHDKAEELMARAADGGHYTLAEKLQVRDVASKFAGTGIEPLAKALHTFWKTPGPRQAAQAWHLWTEGVFHGMRTVERQFQVAHLGAEIRRSPVMSGKLVKLSQKAIDEAADGLRNTETQVRYARAIQDAYGKYSAFDPSTRMIIGSYSAFLPWFLSAVKFVAWTLPRNHPTATGLTAAAVNATEEIREKAGLDLWMPGGAPGWLQGSIDTPAGKIRAGRFTPVSVAADLPGTLAGQVLPLYAGPILALKGLTWDGRRIQVEGGVEGERQAVSAWTALGEWLDSTVPIVAQAKRVDEKGIAALNPLAPTGKRKTAEDVQKLYTQLENTPPNKRNTPEYDKLVRDFRAAQLAVRRAAVEDAARKAGVEPPRNKDGTIKLPPKRRSGSGRIQLGGGTTGGRIKLGGGSTGSRIKLGG